jgi:hypothetical protein
VAIPGGVKVVGNNDPVVSDHKKIWIKQGEVMVCGVLGEGTSKEINVNWDSPFEGEDVGSKFKTASGLTQAMSENTSVTSINTRQIWNGNRPTQFGLTLLFYALSDPASEVMAALQALEEFASPQLQAWSPVGLDTSQGLSNASFNVGRVPQLVDITIGRVAIYPQCVIESISQPLDKEVDRNGLLIRCEVQMQVSTVQVPNRDQVAQFYRG